MWREQLLISLAPDEIRWIRLRGTFTPKISATRILPVEHDYNVRRCDGIIATLLSEARQWHNDALTVRVVLSNQFVRYALVPHSKDVSNGKEEQELARYHYSKIYGDASHGWDIRLSPASSAMRLACAVDAALIAAIQQSFPAEGRPRLASVQPLLMAVFNLENRRFPQTGAWLLMTETDHACVALFVGNSWHTIQNVRGKFADAEACVGLIERIRWSVNLDVVPDTILVHTAQGPPPPSRTLDVWKVIGLESLWPTPLAPARDSAYATTLNAV